MNILVASGDIGGARAVLPVLHYFYKKNITFTVVDHGIIAKDIPKNWHKITDDIKTIKLHIKNYTLLLFTTSVKDTLPLNLARLAKKNKIPVVCLLDNWMNYKYRLSMDKKQTFLPDILLVMDNLAYNEAIKDEIPAKSIRVVGQPALATLANDYKKYNQSVLPSERRQLGINTNKKLISFISEPAKKDQGESAAISTYRGYTEEDVLKIVGDYFQDYSDDFYFLIIPHPRENIKFLSKIWNKHKGKLEGKVSEEINGRKAIIISDGVIGMASIVLYEAWLIRKPVLSLQPSLLNLQLSFFQNLEETYNVINKKNIATVLPKWLNQVSHTYNTKIRKECEVHKTSVANIYTIINNFNNESESK